MSQRLPLVSARQVIRLPGGMGYQVIRQRGSHIRMRKTSDLGEHNITVPDHSTIARGTLNDILNRVSLWNNVPKEALIQTLGEL